MATSTAFNEEQRNRWNGLDGDYWAAQQILLDRTLGPVLPPLMEFAAPTSGSTVIDVGCGCGATTLELVKAVGPSGRVIGIDISEPMLKVAAQRVSEFPNATCRIGDAAELELKGVDADLIVSRFGVMFFGDPVAAFTNLKTGLKASGRLRFACWRPITENPWMNVPLQAVYRHVPKLPAPLPNEPGPFAFAKTDHVKQILEAAGFTSISFHPAEFEMDLSSGGTLEDAVMRASQMGAAKRALAGQPESLQALGVESIRQALASGFKLPAAVWLVAASPLAARG